MIRKENLTYSAFYDRFSGLSDERIMEILKSQNDYQEAARNAAVQIAIDRSLIHSADDLLGPEFQNVGNTKKNIFPTMTNAFNRKRMINSVFRFLLVLTLLPFIFAIIHYSKGNLFFAISGVVFGLVWLSFVFLMKRTESEKFIYPLLAMVFTSAFFVFYVFIFHSSLRFLDFFIFFVGVALSVFFLFYAKKLLNSK